MRATCSPSCWRVPGDGSASSRRWNSTSKCGSSTQYGRPSPSGTSTRRCRSGAARCSRGSSTARTVSRFHSPPGAVEGSRMIRLPTWPTVVGDSTLRNWASSAVSWRMLVSLPLSSVRQARSAAGVEDVHVVGVRRDVDRVTLVVAAARVDADDHLVGCSLDATVAVDEPVRAQLLDDVDLDRQPLALVHEPPGLRAHTDRDVAVRLARRSPVDRDLIVPDPDPALLAVRVEEVHRGRADEAGDEQVPRLVVEIQRGVDLLEDAVLEDRDAVPHRHGLDLVVGDVHGGDAESLLQR